MTSKREVRRRLRALEPPENPEAEARAILLAQRETQRRNLDPVHHPRRKARMARIMLVAAVLGALLLTDPGRSLAERLGELVGIGDEPTEAPVFTNPGKAAQQIVIGVGGGNGDVPRYEVIASQIEETNGEAPLCFRVSFPEMDRRGALQCLTAAALSNLTPETTKPAAFVLEGGDPVVAVGIVGSEVRDVLVGPAGARAGIYRLPPDLLSPDPADRRAGYFVAFTAAAASDPAAIRVRAYGSEGAPLFSGVTGVSREP